MAMKINSLLKDVSNLEGVRLALVKEFDADEKIKDKYDWSHEVVYTTTSQFIEKYLQDNKPSFRFPYNQITENLRQAGNQLEQCLARQDAIFQLETACLAAVIDALNFDGLFEIERTLETQGAVANAKQANATTPPLSRGACSAKI
jgi:hypothetical protein